MDILAKTILDNIVKKSNKYKPSHNHDISSNYNNLSNHEENLLKNILNKTNKEYDLNLNDEIKISLKDLCNKVSKNNNVYENEEKSICNKDEINTVSLDSLWKK